VKYNCVEIRFSIAEGKWRTAVRSLEGDRHEVQTVPNKAGFYHYATEKKTDAEAFEELRAAMVNARVKIIHEFQEELDSLKALEL
jgi:hypothetical protein